MAKKTPRLYSKKDRIIFISKLYHSFVYFFIYLFKIIFLSGISVYWDVNNIFNLFVISLFILGIDVCELLVVFEYLHVLIDPEILVD